MDKKPRSKNWLLIKFREYHTWLGLAVALFVVSTSLTGIVLNHKDLFFGEKKHEKKALESKLTTHTELSALPVSFQDAMGSAAALLGESAALEHIQLKDEHGKLTYKVKAMEIGNGHEVEVLVDPHTGEAILMDGYSMTMAAGTSKERDSVNWKKFINDLHTGEVAGTAGKLLIDFTAIVLTVLTLTGIYLWWIPKMRKKQSQKAAAKRQ